MAPPWRWLLAAVAAVALSLCAPGSMLSQPPAAARAASLEAAVALPGGTACTAVSCNKGSTTASSAAPAAAVVGALALAALVLPLRRTWRRFRAATFALPAGSPTDLLRPPQPALSA